MTSLREAAQQALEALLTYEQYIQPLTNYFGGPRVPKEGSASAKVDAAITTLRAALAEPEQEPVAWLRLRDGKLARNDGGNFGKDWMPLYATPPQRKPLTHEEIVEAVRESDLDWARGWTLDETQSNRFATLARAIERAHGIGGQDES